MTALSCDEVNARLLDLLYGEGTADERRALEAHVEGCARCKADVAALGHTRAQVRVALDDDPPPAVRASILRAAAEAAAPAPAAAAAARPARAVAARSWWTELRRRWTWPTLATVGAVAVALLASRVLLNPEKTLERGHQGVAPVEERERPAAAPSPARAAPASGPAEARGTEAPAPPPAAKVEGNAAPPAVPGNAAPPGAADTAGVGTGAGARARADERAAASSSHASRRKSAAASSSADLPTADQPARGLYDLSGAAGSFGAGSGTLEGRRAASGGAVPSANAARAPAKGFVSPSGAPAPAPAPAPKDLLQDRALERERAYERKREASDDDLDEAASDSAQPFRASKPTGRRAAEPPPGWGDAPAGRTAPAPAGNKGRAAGAAPAPEAAPAAEAATSAAEKAPAAAKAPAAKKKDKAAPPPPPSSPGELVRRADLLFAQGRWADAAVAYDQLLRRFPEAGDAPRWRSRLSGARRAEADMRAAPASAAPADQR